MSRQGWRTKEARRIDRAVRRAGGEVTLTRNGHLRVEYTDRDGVHRSTVVGSKLADPCSFRNAMSNIRRSVGLDLALRPE